MMNQIEARDNMIRQQLRVSGVLDERVLDAIRAVPREHFVNEQLVGVAYADSPLQLSQGSVMMAPADIGRILEAIEIKATDKVLEVGTGSGYMTALLATLASDVYSIDADPEVTQYASEKLNQLHYTNILLSTGRIQKGWANKITVDVIVVMAALPFLPHVLQESLAIGGRLFTVMGHPPVMQATLFRRISQTAWQQEPLFETLQPYLSGIQQRDHFVF